jgi:hypothetical protein
MKNIIFLSILFLLSVNTFAQTKLPKYYIENGDTLGIIMSIQKMKQIKNDLELKMILENMQISCDSTINRFVVLVDDYENRIATFKKTIKSMDSTDKKSTALIDELRRDLELQKTDKSFQKNISLKKDSIISVNETIIRDLKIQRNLGIGGSSTFLVLSIVLGIFLLIH